jgi:hypothetical protein
LVRSVTVAVGVFAHGHLDEQTRQLPFERVDAVLEQTRATEHRLRVLPSRVGVYFVLALGLFQVWVVRRYGARLANRLGQHPQQRLQRCGAHAAAPIPQRPGSEAGGQLGGDR